MTVKGPILCLVLTAILQEYAHDTPHLPFSSPFNIAPRRVDPGPVFALTGTEPGILTCAGPLVVCGLWLAL